MNCRAEITGKTNFPRTSEKVRLVLGLIMILSGFYFGFFSAGAGEGLGFLALMAAPFVMIADK